MACLFIKPHYWYSKQLMKYLEDIWYSMINPSMPCAVFILSDKGQQYKGQQWITLCGTRPLPEPILTCCHWTWTLSHYVNSLWPSDAISCIWQYKSGLTLAQVMACCLMAPSHYLSQCRLLISEATWEQFSSRCSIRLSGLKIILLRSWGLLSHLP